MNSVMIAPNEFSLDGYRQLLRQLKEREYRFCSFHNLQSDRADIILRHDIDLSLEHAVNMATLEAEEGVQASYYVLACSEFYNLLTPSSRTALKRLVELEHEVGLHLDASISNEQNGNLESIATLECHLLEAIIDEPVRSISFHRPAKQYLDNADNLAGRLHAYQPRFFSDIDYCADSTGCWKYGHPLDRESVKLGKPIQLVTHPIWWDRDPASSAIEKIEAFRQSREALLVDELGRNLAPYAEHLKGKE